MLSKLKEVLFSDQGLVDDRDALFTFAIPGLEGEWGFFPPSIVPWKILALVSETVRFMNTLHNPIFHHCLQLIMVLSCSFCFAGCVDPVGYSMCLRRHHLLRHRPTAGDNGSLLARLGCHSSCVALYPILPFGGFGIAESDCQSVHVNCDVGGLLSVHRSHVRDGPSVC